MIEKMTVGEIARLWKEDKRKYVKYSTFAAYALILEDHILPEFEKKTGLEERDVQEFVLKKIKSGLSSKSVKDILVVLRMIMSFGDRSGAWKYERWRIKFPTERTMSRMEILDIEDHRRQLRHLQEQPSLQNIGIYMSLTTGMRIGEICALKWADIDLDAGTISVRRTIERIYTVENGVRHTELVIGPPKTPHSIREIPITGELATLLLPLKQSASGKDYVLTGNERPTEPRTYRNHYDRLLKRLGIHHIKFHGLRHSFATRCIESECDYKTVSAILGHSDIRTTLNLYVHPNMEQKKRCIDKMVSFVR